MNKKILLFLAIACMISAFASFVHGACGMTSCNSATFTSLSGGTTVLNTNTVGNATRGNVAVSAFCNPAGAPCLNISNVTNITINCNSSVARTCDPGRTISIREQRINGTVQVLNISQVAVSTGSEPGIIVVKAKANGNDVVCTAVQNNGQAFHEKCYDLNGFSIDSISTAPGNQDTFFFTGSKAGAPMYGTAEISTVDGSLIDYEAATMATATGYLNGLTITDVAEANADYNVIAATLNTGLSSAALLMTANTGNSAGVSSNAYEFTSPSGAGVTIGVESVSADVIPGTTQLEGANLIEKIWFVMNMDDSVDGPGTVIIGQGWTDLPSGATAVPHLVAVRAADASVIRATENIVDITGTNNLVAIDTTNKGLIFGTAKSENPDLPFAPSDTRFDRITGYTRPANDDPEPDLDIDSNKDTIVIGDANNNGIPIILIAQTRRMNYVKGFQGDGAHLVSLDPAQNNKITVTADNPSVVVWQNQAKNGSLVAVLQGSNVVSGFELQNITVDDADFLAVQSSGGHSGDYLYFVLAGRSLNNQSVLLNYLNSSIFLDATNPNGTTTFTTDKIVAIRTIHPHIDILNFQLNFQSFNGTFDTGAGTCTGCVFDLDNGTCQAEVEKVWGMFLQYNLTINLTTASSVSMTNLTMQCRTANATVAAHPNGTCANLFTRFGVGTGGCMAWQPTVGRSWNLTGNTGLGIDLTNFTSVQIPLGVLTPTPTCEQIACQIYGVWSPGDTQNFVMNKTITATAI